MNQPDALLATKLHIPRVRPGLVARRRLTDELNSGLYQDLTLVVAPAGYGKSIAVTQWAADIDHPVSWLSLDTQDNDPVRFWRHVLAALDAVRPGIAARVGPLAGPPPPPTFDGLVTALINDVAETPGGDDPDGRECVLVLDDYHLIGAEGVHASVRFLVQHRPPQLHIVVAGRADPSLGLAQLRARGQLKELRVAELRFSVEEAGELLQSTDAGRVRALGSSAVAALAARTEGWAAGLQLAALSLREQTDVEGFVAAFTGSHRYVLDYLTEEVLERQDAGIRQFLLETSVLERLSGSLCDAVTRRSDSQLVLEELDRSGLFLVQLDDVRGWWRYHHLFADLLRARLAQDHQRARVLHRRAASWYQEQGLTDDTIHHAVQAGDLDWAAQLIEEHFDTVFNLRGEQATIQSWLPSLPDEVVRGRPRLLLAQAQMAGMRGDLQVMEPLLDAAEEVAHVALDGPFEPTTGRSGSLLVNVPAMIALQRSYAAQLRGQPEPTAAYARKALDHLGPDEFMLSSAVDGFFAVAQWLRGELAEAEDAFEARIGWWRREGQITTTAWGDYCVARLQRGQGRLDASVRTCERALASAAVAGQSGAPPAAGPALVGLAAVAYERNDFKAAHDYAARGITLCRQFVHTPPLAAGLATLAWIRHVTGDRKGALQTMDEAGHFAPGPAGVLNPLPVQRARLLLAGGDVAAAAAWAQDAGISADQEVAYPRELEHLLLAKVLMAQGNPDRALVLLEALEAAAERQHRVGSLIDIRALLAIAAASASEESRAIAALTSALELGCGQRYVRVFVDQGPAMADLLGRLVSQRSDRRDGGVPLACIARIQGAFGRAAPRPPQSNLLEPLTSREREILSLLAAGTSNRGIAEELVVTVDTVKKHVSHVLRKLSAANRTEAVARGRELGELDLRD
jgi:LuxR family maltose regulon positive regulatory protein